jgi:hypothetical protein
VIVSGNDFTDATDVSFNGVSAPIEEISSVQIRTRVPAGATTGPIAITTPLGSVTSTIDFFIGDPPVILAADPDSGKAGASITITGRNFATTMQVSFGGLGIATFVVASDTMISAVVDTLARTGPIYVTNLVRTGSSAFNFTFIPRNPRPELIAVRDVPNDQGGKLIVAWEASEYDRSDYRGITSYRVWRRTYVRTATPARAAGEVRAGSDFGADAVGHVPRGLAASEFWESLAEVPATWLAGYAFAAATLQDSTVAGNPYTAFFVQALTTDRAVFYNSNVDSGYSVDNLAPPQPLPFAAVYSGVDVTLHWVKNAAPDFAEFRLYRGTRPDFTPGSANLVIATADTGHVDVPPSPSTAYYKLAAVDIHGNASRFSAVSPEIPVATLASFVSFQAGPDRIRLTWYSGAALDQPATVERRTGAVGWSRVGDVTADGSGFLVYDDSAVTPGARYGYRLGITSDGAEEFLGEVWVTAASPHVALEGARPNPGSSRLLTVWFELSSGAPARVELLDLAGRRVVEREVGSLGPGPHSVNLASGARLAPGVYHVRLTQGQSRETARVVVID